MSTGIVLATGEVLADRAEWARGPRSRARGLLGRPPLRHGEALVIDGGRQVHTFGMRYPIDVVFCDERWTVLHVVRCMRPARVTRWVRRARYVVELVCGSWAARLEPGARLVVRPLDQGGGSSNPVKNVS